MTMIFVGNLPADTDAARMTTLFERYGPITSIQLSLSNPEQPCSGFGLIEMEESAARKAITDLDGILLDQTMLSVREETERRQPDAEPIPSPMGQDDVQGTLMRRYYNLTEVKKVDGPGDESGDDWYRYVLSSGRAQITGFHRGTLEEVTSYASSSAEDFNLRSTTGKNPGALGYSRKK